MQRSRGVPLAILGLWIAATLFWWGLAFYPAETTSPEWLNVARQVCFGSFQGSLPDATGWILLILGPISFLSAAFMVWPAELKQTMSWAWRGRAGKAGAVLIAFFVFLEGSWVIASFRRDNRLENFSFTNSTKEDLPKDYLRTSRPADDFTLINQTGRGVRLSDYKDQNVLLTFAFAHCQTVCPVLVKDALEAARQSGSRNLQVMIVTLDPWRDTPRSLPTLAEKWNLPANAHVLSGEVADVVSVLKKYQVPYERNEKTGDVVHPALTYLIERGGDIAYSFNNAPVHWLVQALQRIEKHERDITAHR